MKLLAWGRLLRLSLAPTAAADAAAGAVIAWQGFAPPASAWWLVPSSLCIYHGSLALNDWADREPDARARPERPLPSGAVPARAALAVALVLLGLGIALSALASPRAPLWMAGIAACASFYNLAGRGPWLGPLLLGTCRAANLGAGLFVAGRLRFGASSTLAEPELFSPWTYAVPILYGIYVFSVSRLGRLEDSDERLGNAPRAYLSAAALALAALTALALRRPNGYWLPPALLALAGAWPLARMAFAVREWNRGLVLKAMGMSLRRLLVFTAAATLLVPSEVAWIVAAAILAGYPLSFALRRVFPPS